MDTGQGSLVLPVPEAQRTSLENEIDRTAQALSDLSSCASSELVLAMCNDEDQENELLEKLTDKARKNGFVTARVSLWTAGFEALDELLREVMLNLQLPSRSALAETPGFITLLDYYYRLNGQFSQERLSAAIEAQGLAGDLPALVLAYMGADDDAHRELRHFNAWLHGTKLSSARSRSIARGSLNAKTAKKTFSDLTHLLRALGFSGCLICFSEGSAIAKRTERQREKAYIVLRELIDNFDTGRGLVATRMLLTGGRELFEGPKSLQSLEPLFARLRVPSHEQPAPPHRSWVVLGAQRSRTRVKEFKSFTPERQRAARALIRISQGLPPTEAVTSMSVGYSEIDRVIEQLFEHASMSGSVFSVLTGEYGTGKTHLLQHLTERALEQRRPVFRLNLERLNIDLGNPQRHLSRLLDQSLLPLRNRPSALERLHAWTHSPAKLKQLNKLLEEIASSEKESARAAKKVLSASQTQSRQGDSSLALEAILSARDLEKKSGTPAYRHDAYARFLLWLELLEGLEDCRGPVLLIDEAENLYTGGVAVRERRTAMRSLSFYCGGMLPSACVIMAVTPRVLKQLKNESLELLNDISEQVTALDWEDAEMLRRRLTRLKPQPVPEFSRKDRLELAEHVRETHRRVRGAVDDQEYDRAARKLARSEDPPRVLVRALVDRLERTYWASLSQS